MKISDIETAGIFVKVLVIENASTCWIAKRILLGDMYNENTF